MLEGNSFELATERLPWRQCRRCLSVKEAKSIDSFFYSRQSMIKTARGAHQVWGASRRPSRQVASQPTTATDCPHASRGRNQFGRAGAGAAVSPRLSLACEQASSLIFQLVSPRLAPSQCAQSFSALHQVRGRALLHKIIDLHDECQACARAVGCANSIWPEGAAHPSARGAPISPAPRADPPANEISLTRRIEIPPPPSSLSLH